MWSSPNESQASINRHRCSLAHYGNKAFFSKVCQEWASLHPALFSHCFCCCVVLAYTKNLYCSLCKARVLHCPCSVSGLCAGVQIPQVWGDASEGFPLCLTAKLGFTPYPSQDIADFEDLAQAHPLFNIITQTALLCFTHTVLLAQSLGKQLVSSVSGVIWLPLLPLFSSPLLPSYKPSTF